MGLPEQYAKQRQINRVMVWRFFRLACAATILAGTLARAPGQGLAASPGRTGKQDYLEGWTELPNTRVSDVCPEPAPGGNTGCAAVISAWSGGIADTKENRLILWGGGHQDYYGNEVYALNLTGKPASMARLTKPSEFNRTCDDAQNDGNPTARHTYGGLAYLAEEHAMYAFSGSKSNCGYQDNDTWILDLTTLRWQRRQARAESPKACVGCIADFDSQSHLVYVTDLSGFWSYDARKNAYKRVQQLKGVDYHLSGLVADGLFLMVGGPGQMWAIDIRPGSGFRVEDWSHKTRGCDLLLHASYPGLAYDTLTGVVVGWIGGNTVQVFNPRARTCTAETYPNGPGAAQGNGTHGRFRYFPGLDVFALVNDWQQDAFVLRRRRR